METVTLPLATLQNAFLGPRFKKTLQPEVNVPKELALVHSFAVQGILAPLVLTKDPAGSLLLIDGFHRLHYARTQAMTELCCQIVSFDDKQAIADIIFFNECEIINASMAHKALFIKMLRELGLDDKAISQRYLPLMELASHSTQLNKILAVAALDTDILAFCHDKGFAFKQCFHLTRHPADLITEVFNYRHAISLTANTFELLLDHISDILRWQDKPLQTFLSENRIRELIADTAMTPQQRTKVLLDKVRTLRYPRLSTANEKIAKIKNSMLLPEGVTISYDPTLESKRLSVTINIEDPSSYPSVAMLLASPATAHKINQIFAEL